MQEGIFSPHRASGKRKGNDNEHLEGFFDFDGLFGGLLVTGIGFCTGIKMLDYVEPSRRQGVLHHGDHGERRRPHYDLGVP